MQKDGTLKYLLLRAKAKKNLRRKKEERRKVEVRVGVVAVTMAIKYGTVLTLASRFQTRRSKNPPM